MYIIVQKETHNMIVFIKNKILVKNGVYDFDSAYINSHSGLEIINCSDDLPPNWKNLTSWISVNASLELKSGEELIGLRDLWHIHGDEVFASAGRALQFSEWFGNVKLCSHCGGKIKPSENDYGRVCENCGSVFYVPVSPAIIVAVEHDDKLLLAHNTAWPDERYSVIAGFVEPGETLEDTVRREVYEEVMINVDGIKYFASQSWPFPHSLMLGFTARYSSGKIKPDGTEIASAGFYSPEEIMRMNIPDKASIARRLIDDFLSRH